MREIKGIYMSDDKIIDEVLVEDAAGREILRWQLKGFIPGVEGISKAVLKPWVVLAFDYDALRQQLADVSNERDGLRVELGRLHARLREEQAYVSELSTEHTAMENLLSDAIADRDQSKANLTNSPPEEAWRRDMDHRPEELGDPGSEPATDEQGAGS